MTDRETKRPRDRQHYQEYKTSTNKFNILPYNWVYFFRIFSFFFFFCEKFLQDTHSVVAPLGIIYLFITSFVHSFVHLFIHIFIYTFSFRSVGLLKKFFVKQKSPNTVETALVWGAVELIPITIIIIQLVCQFTFLKTKTS